MKTKMLRPYACIALAVLPLAPMCYAKTNHSKPSNYPASPKGHFVSAVHWDYPNNFLPSRSGIPSNYKFIDTAMMTSHYIVGEAPSGSLNGVNRVFTLLHAPLKGKDAVYLNGVLQVRGTNYTITTTTITMTIAPFAGDLIRVIYYY